MCDTSYICYFIYLATFLIFLSYVASPSNMILFFQDQIFVERCYGLKSDKIFFEFVDEVNVSKGNL